MKRYAALLCCGVLLFWWLLPGSPAAVSAAGREAVVSAAVRSVAAVPARAGKGRRACRAALPVAGGCLPDKGWLCGRTGCLSGSEGIRLERI